MYNDFWPKGQFWPLVDARRYSPQSRSDRKQLIGSWQKTKYNEAEFNKNITNKLKTDNVITLVVFNNFHLITH